MSSPVTPEGIRAESIFHPSDFSEASNVAFAHALKLALVARASLRIMHVSSGHDVDWHDFPGVRETLERWKLIPPGSPRSAVEDLGIDVRKVKASSNDPVKACLGFLETHPADLIVLAVHQREGSTRWLAKSVGEPIARGAGEVTLFIPHGVPGFVSLRDGTVSLKSILIPVTSKPRPQPSVDAASRLIRNFQLPAGAITLLHVGTPGDMPSMHTPDVPGWQWTRRNETGEPAETILRIAGEEATDLIMMTTDGPDGFLDGLRGTTSERVLRKARCPVANLPVGSQITG